TTARDTIARQNERLQSAEAQLAAFRAELEQLRTAGSSGGPEPEQAKRELETVLQERSWLEAEVDQARTVLANEKSRWQTERTQLERRLSQRDAELAAVRSRGGQTSPM